MPRAKPGDPINLLLDYQAAWVNDAARWKFGLWSRQTGKDFSSGFEGIRDCLAAEKSGVKTDWLIAAPSERQSLESLEKWKEWARVFDLAVDDYREERDGGSETVLKSAIITFPKGSRVIAVPGKPDTCRGFCANVLMTEFAFFEQPDLTWRAIYPSITNPKRGLKKIRLITTPNGIGNKAHDIWVSNYGKPKPEWSCHFVDINMAAPQLGIDVEKLRAGYGDDEGWAQEYLCQFMDVQSTLLPYELIAGCETVEASEIAPSDYFTTNTSTDFLGIDFGRTRDLTCAWLAAPVGDLLHTREVLTLSNMPTPDQIAILRPRIRRAMRVCLDYTGPGVGMGDYLVQEFGQYDPVKHLFGKIELCTFTNALKVDIFSKLRMAFEKVKLRIPVNRVIREDLHSMNRVATPSGQITYKAPHTADGHADRCTALALCLRARGDGTGPVVFSRLANPIPTVGALGLGKHDVREVEM